MAEQQPPLPTQFEMFQPVMGGDVGQQLGQRGDYFDAQRSTEQVEGLTDAQRNALMAQRYQAAQAARQAAEEQQRLLDAEARKRAAQADILKMALDVRKNPGLSDAEKQTAIEAGVGEISQKYQLPGQAIPAAAPASEAPTDEVPPMLARPKPEEEQPRGGLYPKFGTGTNLARAERRNEQLLSDSEKDLNTSTNAQVEAQKAVIKQEENNAQREAAYFRVQQDQAILDAANARSNEQRRQEAINGEMTKYQSLVKDLGDGKIKPWTSQNIGKRIAVGIAAGLMNMAGALSRQGNAAAGMPFLAQMFDQDLAQQRAELDRKRSVVDAQGNLLGIMRQNFGDERTAEAATRAMQYEAAEMELKQILAMNKSEIAQANGATMLAAIQVEKSKSLATLRDHAAGRFAEIAARRDQLDAQLQIAAMDAMKAGDDLSVPGLTGQAISKEAQIKVAEFKAHADTLSGSINELRQLHQRFGRELFRSEGAQRATELAADIQLALKSTNGLGTLDAGATEFLDKMISSDPTAVSNFNFDAKLNQLQSNESRRADNYYKSMIRGYRSIKANETVY